MKIAVVGCCHGKIDEIYAQINEHERQVGKVDLVLFCGDFQAVRGLNDLKCMAVSVKFKELGDFHGYYNGNKEASHLTLVIGGNHEASNYFQTLPYGGWIAPNIYYMGYSNVVKFNGLRIGAISGIFKQYSTDKGYFEHLPYNSSTIRSAYHTRYLDAFRIMQVKEKLDIMLTHDWPLDIYNMPGAKEYLLRKKKHFRNDINNHQLGSPMHKMILNRLKPKHWFAAHLHVRFETNYIHRSIQDQFNEKLTNEGVNYQLNDNSQLNQTFDSKLNEDKQSKDISEKSESQQEKINERPNLEITHFLALDKCVLGRKYLEFIEIYCDQSDNKGLEYDLEWLAILRCTNQYVSTQEYPSNYLPKLHVNVNYDLDSHKEKIKEKLNDDLKIPKNFKITLPYNSAGEDIDPHRINNYVNEQTTTFCKLIELTDPTQSIVNRLIGKTNNPDKINISDDELINDSAEEEKNNNNKEKMGSKDEPKAKKCKEDKHTLFFIDTKGSN